MQNAWWMFSAGLLIWGLATEGLAAVLWSLAGTLVAVGIVVAIFVLAVNPTGAVILTALALAGGTWRLMWWLTDRGYI